MNKVGMGAWIAGLALIARICAAGATVHVSPVGDDDNDGSVSSPYRTIQAASERLHPGDVCIVHGGVYRETVRPKRSGVNGKPIRFEAAPGTRPVLDGTEPVVGPWSVFKGAIHRTRIERDFIQLFVDGRMMVEARWPNRTFPDQLWDRDRWARAGKGSRHGRMVDPMLAETGIDWTGAIAVLNVAHQFYTWTRPVLRHAAGSDAFDYARDLKGITHYDDKTKPWEDDRYYLVGKLEALDQPGEWFLDRAEKTLYLWLPDGGAPLARAISVKARDYGVEVDGKNFIEFHGFDFFGCAFLFKQSSHGVVDNCRLHYPAFARRLGEPGHGEDKVFALMEGRGHIVRGCLFAWASTDGLKLVGQSNTVEDCLVRDTSWDGSLHHVAVSLNNTGGPGDGSTARQCTVFDIGTVQAPGNFINLHTMPEPTKTWRKQDPLLERQNENSLIANNAARTLTGDNKGAPYEFKRNLANNYQEEDLHLMDPKKFDFRPRPDSPLVDAGKVIPGITGGFVGKAPDIGAYEVGAPPWRPGITWQPVVTE